MPTMPDRSSEFLGWLQVLAPSLYPFALSAVIAVFRVIYGGGSTRQAFLEGVLCGLATVTIVPLLQYFGLLANMATFAGGCVGFLGVQKVRDYADKFISRKVGE